MTDKKDEALKLALEALRAAVPVNAKDSKIQLDAIFAIREALAEQPANQLDDINVVDIQAQQHEPYGWKVFGVSCIFMGEFAEHEAKSEAKRIGGNSFAFPLYTSTPASKPWVGLTDEERRVIIEQWHWEEGKTAYLCRLTEAKLKEKNNG